MWTRIVGGMVVLLVASFAVQWVLPRSMRARRPASRQYLKKDVAPVLGFFGLLLVVLSLIQAVRNGMLIAWGSGGGLGLVASVVLWVALVYLWGQPEPPVRKKESSIRVALRIIRSFGLPFILCLLVVNIAVRVLGIVAEIFLAGAFGIFIVAIAVAVYFAAAQRQAT